MRHRDPFLLIFAAPGGAMELALAEATQNGDAQEVSRLLESGANPNVPDELGEPPIFEAVACGSAKILTLLLLAKADPRFQSPQGLTARQMADQPLQLLLDLFCGEAKIADLGSLDLPAPLLRRLKSALEPVKAQAEVEEAEAFAPREDEEEPEVAAKEAPEKASVAMPAALLEVPEEAAWPEVSAEESEAPAEVPTAAPVEDLEAMAASVEEPEETKVAEAAAFAEAAALSSPEAAPPEAMPLHVAAAPREAVPPAAALPPVVLSERGKEGSTPASSSAMPGTTKASGARHVVLHSPLVALRQRPCFRSPKLRSLRPGEEVLLAEWDATRVWRRLAQEEAWVPVKHPSLGCLLRPEAGGNSVPEMAPVPLPALQMSVAEAWRQLYEGGVLNIPPPKDTASPSSPSLAAQALMEAATMGRAATPEGEKALAALDVATVEYVMSAALRHLS
ncbi:unnamed protein product [Effrenium voratum]|uniref:Uncharacterized protein n=1 Tax=Effrenium voratum TaxID=2562239 RepID=A0AA36IUH8_9DINO|nr:unnamed protein product [Effrenium voratum]